MSIIPYTIAIAQADLDDLKERLAHVRWTNELPGVGLFQAVLQRRGSKSSFDAAPMAIFAKSA